MLQVQTLRFPVTPSYFTGLLLQGRKDFSFLFLYWNHKSLIKLHIQRTVQSRSSVIFTRCVQNTHHSVIYKKIFKRRNIAWAALLKAEAILIKESLLPLPAEVVNSVAHMPVNCLLWKQRCELGFSAHRLVLRRQNQLSLLEVPETITELLFLEK